jgi:hypothetical protein
MVSSRYAPAVCALVAVALVPTLIHSYAGVRREDGRTTVRIPVVLAGFAGTPSSRDRGWGARRFESTDWTEREYVAGSNRVLLTVVRSYDLKRLYHHPELDVAYGVPFVAERIERFADRPDMPVHVLRSGLEEGPAAGYVLEYGGEFIADPVRFQIRTTGELLFQGRRPMTVFFARDLNSQSARAPFDSLPSVKLARAAAEAFLTQPTGQ